MKKYNFKKIIKKNKKKIKIELFDLMIVLVLVLLLVIVLKFAQIPIVGKAYTTIQSEHIIANVNLPDTIYVNEEFMINLNLDISGISNGVLVTINIPSGLVVNSVNPSNAVVAEDTIARTLAPNNHALSFGVISGAAGNYELKVKFGTYDNLNEIAEENSAIVLLDVMERLECETYEDCDDGEACTDDFCEDNKCVNSIIDYCCHNNSECEDFDACTTDYCMDNICFNDPLDCEDGNYDTEDVCMYGGRCIHFLIGGCKNDAECDDYDACTTDTCVNMQCEHDIMDCGNGYHCENGVCVSDDPCATGICDCYMCPRNCGPGDCI